MMVQKAGICGAEDCKSSFRRPRDRLKNEELNMLTLLGRNDNVWADAMFISQARPNDRLSAFSPLKGLVRAFSINCNECWRCANRTKGDWDKIDKKLFCAK